MPQKFKKGQRVEYKALIAYAKVVEDSSDTTTLIKWDDWHTRRRGKRVTYVGGTIRVLTFQLELVE